MMPPHHPQSLPEVEYDIAIAHADVPWHVTSLRLAEILSEPYECAVEVATEAPSLVPSMLLGSPVVLTIRRDPIARRVCGIVTSVQDEGSTADRRVFDLSISPALWALTQRSHRRIFHDLDAVAIVRALLHDAGLYPGEQLVVVVPPGTVAPREVCIQLGETDLAFMRRVLDDEGLTFTFAHEGSSERLVIFDPAALSAMPAVATLDGAPAPLLGGGAATASVESIVRLDSRQELVPTGVSLRDHHFTRHDSPLESGHARPVHGSGGRVLHEYPARFNLGRIDAETGAHAPPNTRRAALVRHEAVTTRGRFVRGVSTVTGIEPGRLLDVDEDADRDLDARFLVTRATHVGHAPEVLYSSTEGTRGLDRYSNHFELSPVARVFRPTPAPRPAALAPLCAVVVATPGSHDEICTDRLGRVLVRFPWDGADGDSSKPSSCWLRVSQAWAGSGLGTTFVPRVGSEVIVQFMDGDPDRPFVAGCLFNHAHPPPVELPTHRTRSVIRTQSVPRTGGYNELSFEDAAGREEVHLRAQRDLRERVLHDHHTHVGSHRVSQVAGSSLREVGGDDSTTVHGSERAEVRGHRQRVTHGDEVVSVGGRHAITVRHAASVHVNETHRLTADEGAFIEVGGSARIDTTPEEITLEAPEGVTLRCGGTTLTMTPTGITLSTEAGTRVSLEGASVTVQAAADVTVLGRMVKIN
jgi:type VI secretion system secreted protein VgrG